MKRVYQSLFPKGHPYYADVIGSHADIQAAKLDDVKGFFKQYYTPNNASLAIVGDVDKAQVKTLVEKYFGTLKRGPDVPKVTVQTPPITSERKLVVKDHVQLPRVYMTWLTPAYFRAGRRGRRHRRGDSRRRALEPALQGARLRQADRAGRLGRAAVALAVARCSGSSRPRVPGTRPTSSRRPSTSSSTR